MNMIILAAIVAFVMGVVLCILTAKRVPKMPTGAAAEDEIDFIIAALNTPEYFSNKSIEDIEEVGKTFSVKENANLLVKIKGLHTPEISSEELITRALKSGVDTKLIDTEPKTTSCEELNLVEQEFKNINDTLVDYGGANPPVRDKNGNIVRLYKKPSTKKLVLSGIAGFLILVLILLAKPSSLFEIGLLSFVAFTGLYISLIDIDTLFIDVATLRGAVMATFCGLVVYLIGIISSSFEAFNLFIIIGGLILVTAVMVGLLFLFKRLRGQDGLGNGDAKLLVLVLWLPTIITGDLLVGVGGLSIACGLAVVSKVIMVALGRSTMKKPEAFAPYLCGGWLIAAALITQYSIGAGPVY